MYVNYCDSCIITVSDEEYFKNGVLSCKIDDTDDEGVYKIIICPTSAGGTDCFFCIGSIEYDSINQEKADTIWAAMKVIQLPTFNDNDIVGAIGDLLRIVTNECKVSLSDTEMNKITYHMCSHAVGRFVKDHEEAKEFVARQKQAIIDEINEIFAANL